MSTGLGDNWLVFHGGALGDLALTARFALQLPGMTAASTLTVISRVRLGDLPECRPSIRCISTDSIRSHWLHGDADSPPPERLRALVAGANVWNALTDECSLVHRRLLSLGPRALWSTDPRPAPNSEAHITAQWRQRLEKLGLAMPACTYRRRDRTSLSVPEPLRERGRRRMSDVLRSSTAAAGLLPVDTRCVRGAASPDPPTASGAVLVHPGGGSPAKCWPLASFLDAARRVRKAGRLVVFIVGPVELDTWPDSALEAIRREFPLLELADADELPALLSGAAVLLSNDSGPAHLAAMLGTPTVTLFGPTPAAVWRPIGRAARVIAGDALHGRGDWDITVEDVARRVTAAWIPHSAR